MKQTIISLLIIFSFLEVFSEESDEIKWVVDTEAGINDVLLSPLGEVTHNRKKGMIAIDQIRTIDKRRVQNIAGKLSENTIMKVKSVIKETYVD